jgi:hypothetical protein
VQYVLADTEPEDTSCMSEITEIDQGVTEMRVFEVVPEAAQ